MIQLYTDLYNFKEHWVQNGLDTEQTWGEQKALEVIQEWDCENLDSSGSCEDEETWIDSEMRISNPY